MSSSISRGGSSKVISITNQSFKYSWQDNGSSCAVQKLPHAFKLSIFLLWVIRSRVVWNPTCPFTFPSSIIKHCSYLNKLREDCFLYFDSVWIYCKLMGIALHLTDLLHRSRLDAVGWTRHYSALFHQSQSRRSCFDTFIDIAQPKASIILEVFKCCTRVSGPLICASRHRPLNDLVSSTWGSSYLKTASVFSSQNGEFRSLN